MSYKKQLNAPIAARWRPALVGMVAGLGMLAAAPGTFAQVQLDDVQVGERENQTRIALICSAPCVLEKRGAREFLLRGVDSSLELDLSTRTQNVSMLHAVPTDEGTLLSLSTVGNVEYANTKNCTIGGRAAACIDLFFDLSLPQTVTLETPSKLAGGAALNDSVPSKADADRKSVVAKPVLREGSPERMLVFASLAPPERFLPPTGAVLASVQPVEKITASKPAIRTGTAHAPAAFDYNRHIAVILSKELTPMHCTTAEATLQVDAWALDAMVDAGLCAAARGDVAQADEMLARLLEFTPDNYEALVGRALIAVQAQEKGVARKYFQDALNALPPIEESNRIVEAMTTL